ncbi:hypothetical protein GLOIN_2v1769322 [Rhizophagus irregularis DAOM 181602=DAOM 197198]|uniref:Uncharacterized protein n=1 Tax=Rhizophagus irregularis (strain DAOM 181602 / DAOM 197198 / MUCL 43194) TaxID=747089 RepID=A0A2P4QF94_RHIID|nr:hypothetical protein GLOIN_2v1769322 [Rhizophagus irregularis DAOM 181602=DAOM 197198]POG76290.1 hypothetical protein GLOIN_2v1769322 [Rhizophagus irregularis DAOM 181602=DAOM 197198]|eukprot:XP_025183156.1 hypothetical protein GLOIN_2v1769322 [Rhizophagus irregularis DAOM 181602=DAOM 197198]
MIKLVSSPPINDDCEQVPSQDLEILNVLDLDSMFKDKSNNITDKQLELDGLNDFIQELDEEVDFDPDLLVQDIWEANLENMNRIKSLLNRSHYFPFRYWIWLDYCNEITKVNSSLAPCLSDISSLRDAIFKSQQWDSPYNRQTHFDYDWIRNTAYNL